MARIPQVKSTSRPVSSRVRQEAKGLRTGENAILEMMALGAPLSDVLDRLMRLKIPVQRLLASILLLDPEGKRYRHLAGPSFPTEYMRAIDGSPIGPKAGSCGTAAYRKKQVIVADIQTDPLWADFDT